MQRRKLICLAAAGTALPAVTGLAQPGRRVRRIGYFSLTTEQDSAAWLVAFRDGMAELRQTEGRDYVIDARYANGIPQTAAGLAAELVATQPDLLLTVADEAARQLAQRTQTIPIVFAIAQDPIATGLAKSLQKPGGNVTGLASLTSELGAKRLQLLKEAFPKITHVALLFEPENVGSARQAKEIEAAAPLLGLRLTPIGLRLAADVDAAFKQAVALGVNAFTMTHGGIIANRRKAIADQINRLKLPASFPDDRFVEVGGLMSYGASQRDNFRRAAAYVDKIFRGAKPGDLPIEQPTKFDLVVNLKTVKAIGLTLPPSFVVQVSRVIE